MPDAPADLPPLTAAQARAVDRYAVETLGLPGLVLMENAAINTAAAVIDLLGDIGELDRDRFVVGVLCGGGNNGGDGYALARHLLGLGIDVTVYAAKPIDELDGDAAVNAAATRRLGIPVRACQNGDAAARFEADFRGSHVLVDALLGTGFSGQVRDDAAGVIRVLNAVRAEASSDAASGAAHFRGRGPRVVAVDVPSGLNADTGQPGGVAVEADLTVTFVAPKAGFAAEASRKHLGRVVVADIGLPDAAVWAALRETRPL